MAKEFLTQNEVDALLEGVSGEAPAAAPAKAGGEAQVQPYNVATQERIVRGRMPTFELINERFARLMRVGLFNFMRRSAEISVGPVRAQKYGEFLRSLAAPVHLNMVELKPLRGNGVFVFDPALVALVIDTLFGGDGRFPARDEAREFTPTERRIVERLMEVAFENLEQSWKPVYPVKFESVRAEPDPQVASIATPNEIVITTTFTIELGGTSGDFHLCLPYAMIEPIRDVLNSTAQGERNKADKRWLRLLSRQVQSAEVELVANLGCAKLTLSQVNGLQVGDVIPLQIPAELIATVDGVPVMECNHGVFNGQYALRVQRMINHSVAEQNDH